MSKPKSRRIPSLVSLVIAAVLMVVLWVFLAVWLPYHREQVAIREITRLGGWTNSVWSGPEWVVNGPEWLQELVENGWLAWFDRVNQVDLYETTADDEGLKHVSGLSNLVVLDLSGTQISDAGLKHVSSSTNLVFLHLSGTQISDEGLKYLSGLTNLSMLFLENTCVSNEGVRELKKSLPDCAISGPEEPPARSIKKVVHPSKSQKSQNQFHNPDVTEQH